MLQHYKVELKVKGRQANGFCPLPGHEGEKKPSFSVNLEKKIFQCFGCGAKGNVLDFAVLMENRNPKRGEDVHDVAMELKHRFVSNAADKSDASKEPAALKPFADLPAIVNPPLDFELRDLDAEHPYLKARGFTRETVKQFGLGFCTRGMLKDRIAIPLHDSAGKLVGYAGRLIDDKAVSEANPKYRFPTDRERGGNLLEFRKSLLLYNGPDDGGDEEPGSHSEGKGDLAEGLPVHGGGLIAVEGEASDGRTEDSAGQRQSEGFEENRENDRRGAKARGTKRAISRVRAATAL